MLQIFKEEVCRHKAVLDSFVTTIANDCQTVGINSSEGRSLLVSGGHVLHDKYIG